MLIGDRENRMRAGLCHDISMRPYSGRRKIAIMDDADFLNVEGANSLLKTLEEPPPDSLLILVAPTFKASCQPSDHGVRSLFLNRFPLNNFKY